MEIELLYSQYQNAVKNRDIDGVLKFGELYFTRLNGKMTNENKEQLQNDILLCAAANKDENNSH